MTPEDARSVGEAVGTIVALIVMIAFLTLAIFLLVAMGGYLAHTLWDLFLWGWERAG